MQKIKTSIFSPVFSFFILLVIFASIVSCEYQNNGDTNSSHNQSIDWNESFHDQLKTIHKEQKYLLNENISKILEKLLKNTITNEEKEKSFKAHLMWLQLRTDKCVEDNIHSEIDLQEIVLCLQQEDKKRINLLANLNIVQILQKPSLKNNSNPASNISFDLEGITVYKISLANDNSVSALFSSHRKTGDQLYLMDLNTGNFVHTISAVRPPFKASFSQNNRILFVSSYTNSRNPDTFKVIDVETGEILLELDEQITHFELIGRGEKIIFSENKKFGIYDFLQGGIISKNYGVGEPINCLVVNRKQDQLVTGGNNKLTLWHFENKENSRFEIKKEIEISRSNGTISTCESTQFSEKLLLKTSKRNLILFDYNNLLELNKIHLNSFVIVPNIIKNLKDDIFFVNGKEGSALKTIFIDTSTMKGNYVEMIANNAVSIFNGDKILFANRKVLQTKDSKVDMMSLKLLFDIQKQKIIEKNKLYSAPRIQKLPTDFTVEAIGVYEGKKPEGSIPWWAEKGRAKQIKSRIAHGLPVIISIGTTEKPIVLVLSSANKVIWTIKGNVPRHILLSGNSHSSILNPSGAQVTYIGESSSYKNKGRSYYALSQSVTQYLGKRISNFQGAYNGTNFQIGLSGIKSIEDYKHISKDGKIEYSDKKNN